MAFYARRAHVVQATKDGQTEYWAAASHRDDALALVGSQTPSDWNLLLTERCLKGEQAADLKMMHDSVRKLTDAAEMPSVGRLSLGIARSTASRSQ